MRMNFLVSFVLFLVVAVHSTRAFLPLLDGGKEMPALYKGWFDSQVAKQSAAAVQRAVSAGKTKIEVQFPPVPNVDEVKFGTPLNQKFGTSIIAKDLNVKGGYKPGSDLSRNLIAFSNIYWAKQIAPSVGGGLLGKPVAVVSAEPVTLSQIQSKGPIARLGMLGGRTTDKAQKGEAMIVVNPGGEETWERIRTTFDVKGPFVILNNSFSTTYDLGNKRGYEEAYYLKRISKGWIFRSFPGPWQAYLERPDGSVELLQSYKAKPPLNEVATYVRDESFRRYAINNDRFAKGFGARL